MGPVCILHRLPNPTRREIGAKLAVSHGHGCQNAQAMPKIDIWNQLTAQSQAAVHRSRELAASFKPGAIAPLQLAREGYLHERRYWNSFAVPLRRA